jgi:pilus assembly protein CpaE
MSPIRVAVAAPFPEVVRIHDNAAEYADELEVCAMISSAESVLEQARLLQPDVLLLSDRLTADGTNTLAQLTAVAPAARLVLMVTDVAGAPAALADAVIGVDASAVELRDAVVAAVELGREQPPTEARADDASPPGEEAALAGSDPGRVVVVFSGKGGVGTSIVAVNLATALALHGARVAIADLDLQFGDVGVLVHLEAHPTSIAAITQPANQVDPAVLEGALATSVDGVRVLLAPDSPESSDAVSAARLVAILHQLARTHDYVVVDSPSQLEERIVAVMELADQLLLVSSFGVTSVKDTKLTLRLLQSLGIERERVVLVLNQTSPRTSVAPDEIAGALRFPILVTLPFEPRMEAGEDIGRPLVASEPRSPFSTGMAAIAGHVERGPGVTTARGNRHATRWRLRFRH